MGIWKRKFKSKQFPLSATRIAMLQEGHGIVSRVWANINIEQKKWGRTRK
jgi:hypothetical protein